MEEEFYLYKITNTISNRQYVGITKNYNRRINEHRLNSSNADLKADISKLGWNTFNSQILCVGYRLYILALENSYLTKYLHKDKMYNKNTGGSCNGGTFGENHGRAKLSDLEVIEILKEYNKGMHSYSSLGRLYNVTESTIGKIIRGELWSHLSTFTKEYIHVGVETPRKNNARDSIDMEVATNIRQLYATGKYTYKDIAKLLNNTISHTAVGKIVRNERWKI